MAETLAADPDHAPAGAPSLGDKPRGSPAAFLKYFRYDCLSGFLVFLIALPLCLAIASACGFPPIAGVFTAILGGVLTPLISNSELTIKGPAAGLIVIVLGCVQEFGGASGVGEWGAADDRAYRAALAVGVVAACLQIVLGLVRAGSLGELFPTSAVHGMLAAIGVIIISKQLPIVLGTGNKGEPLELLRDIPQKIRDANPQIACIGLISLLILFGKPWIRNRWIKLLPAPLLVVLAAIPLGMYFQLEHTHYYTFMDHPYQIGEKFLVSVPANIRSALTSPDFSVLSELKAWKWVLMFLLIGSLESILSAKAVDMLDPWRRRSNMNRDLLGVGVGNLAAAMVGGLPMISEIVRSKANVDNGARTRFANMWHGLFLLVSVSMVPWLIHRIPLTALAAMLVYTGFRLASPREFASVYKVGWEQLVIFVSTIIGVLATDLLIGIGIGIAVEFLLHLVHYRPVRSLFACDLVVDEPDPQTYMVKIHHAAVFSNWMSLKRQLSRLHEDRDVILDLSETHLVDHTVMEKLHELEEDFSQTGRTLHVVGLDKLRPYSEHPRAARRR